MFELLCLVFGMMAGFSARPYYERWRAERAAEQAKLKSREKRSASAKAAAVRRAKAMADGVGVGSGLNGSGSSYQPRDTEQQP